MTTSDKPLDWINSIAQECQETSEFVQEVLDKYGVQQTPNIGKPKRLIIKHLQFSGQKAGKYTNSFQFEFTELEQGLWGLFSDGNLKGKTSTLEIVRWLLRGKPSSNFQGEVKKWIQKARLDFSLGDQVYQVDVNQTQEGMYGTLKEKGKNNFLEISKFYSESAFETCMSDFMRKQLSLDFISAWRTSTDKDQNEMGKSVIHDWSALSGILFIGGDYKCLFGDVFYAGLDNRLMNMYLGLPWIPTDSALKVLDKKLENKKEILKNNYQSEQKQRQDRRSFIEQQLETYRSDLDQIPLNVDIRDQLNQENQAYLQAQQKTRELNNKLNMIMQDSHQIEMCLIQVKRDYQYFQEAKAVNIIFNGLEPTCCPHCQTSISDERRLQEIQTHSCSLCGEEMISDLEADDFQENEMKEQLTKLSEELKEYEQLILSLKNEIFDSEDKVTQSKLRCEQLEAKINDFNQRYELERKISGLEFLLNEEHQEYPEFSEGSEIQKPSNKLEVLNREIKVIKKAIVETKRRIESRQKDLLIEVSKKIKEYAIRFGMTSLEEVELKTNPQLLLKKDGGNTTYTKCTNGERLRLKIASIIALISIAENQGIGRHPGLLLIDSPKREEITDKDVAQIVAGLEALTKELPYLQVFLAATASESILGYFDEDHRKYAKGDDFLW